MSSENQNKRCEISYCPLQITDYEIEVGFHENPFANDHGYNPGEK